MVSLRRAAITGGPGVGKSTLLRELDQRGYQTQHEVARAILRSAGGMELRASRPLEFALAMLEAQQAIWQASGTQETTVVFDRGFPDIVGFLRVEGLAVPSEVDRACRALRFDGPVFRAPPWQQIYLRDNERTQDWSEALESDKAISSAWRDYGYRLVDLPLTGISERADFVAERL